MFAERRNDEEIFFSGVYYSLFPIHDRPGFSAGRYQIASRLQILRDGPSEIRP
jgi:hypothetical protein